MINFVLILKKLGYCSACNDGEKKYIVNQFHKLCIYHYQKKIKSNKKPTGEKELFAEIWAERPHVCVNCKVQLGTEARVHYFSHIKPKSTHPELRLNKDNIQILCMDCHNAYDFQGKKNFEKRFRN